MYGEGFVLRTTGYLVTNSQTTNIILWWSLMLSFFFRLCFSILVKSFPAKFWALPLSLSLLCPLKIY